MLQGVQHLGLLNRVYDMGEPADDWFFNSISRYKNLGMFELEYPVQCVEATNSNSICVSCSDNKRHQLLELSLPLKLTSQVNSSGNENVLTNDYDLKIKCGIFTHAPVTEVKTTCTDRKAIVSHLNTKGVTVYQLTVDDSDEIKKESVIKCELETPFLGLNDTELILAKNTATPTFLADISTGKLTVSLPVDDTSPLKEPVSPVFVEPKLVALCRQHSGLVQLYDSRDFKLIHSLSNTLGNDHNFWRFTSMLESSEKMSSGIETTCLAMISNCGVLRFYDSRNWTIPVVNAKLSLAPTTCSQMQLRLKPSKDVWMSVSGCDGNVHVYRLVPEPESVFVHDGHRYVEGFCPETVTSSHLWFPNIDNLIISSADNGTVQSWQFETKKN